MRRKKDESTAGMRGRILALLCSGNRTSAELARELRITANGVRGHLHRLNQEGLIDRRVVRRGVGKPAHEYFLTSAGSIRLSRGYLPLLSELLAAASRRGGREEEETLLRAAGRAIARRYPRPEGELRGRAEAAVELIAELGGISSLRMSREALWIEGSCCVLRALVPEHPAVCKAVAAMLTEYMGVSVEEACERQVPPLCRLVIATAEPYDS